jgi:hypothetical protein
MEYLNIKTTKKKHTNAINIVKNKENKYNFDRKDNLLSKSPSVSLESFFPSSPPCNKSKFFFKKNTNLNIKYDNFKYIYN